MRIYLLPFLLLFSLCSCGTKTPSIKGILIDNDTGSPIRNAHILITWRGIAGSTSFLDGLKYQRTTFKVDSLVTNSKGEFYIPSAYTLKAHYGKINILIHAPKYKNITGGQIFPEYSLPRITIKNPERKSITIRLEKDKRPSADRISYLESSFQGHISAIRENGEKGELAFYSIYREIYKEAITLAKNNQKNKKTQIELQKLCTKIVGIIYINDLYNGNNYPPSYFTNGIDTFKHLGDFDTSIFPLCKKPPTSLPKNIFELKKQIKNVILGTNTKTFKTITQEELPISI